LISFIAIFGDAKPNDRFDQGERVVTVSFWNIGNKPGILPHLGCLAANQEVDVFLLAESPTDWMPALTVLNGLGNGTWREETNGGSKIRALTRIKPAEFIHRFTGIAGDVAGWALQATKLSPVPEVLLAGVHLPSKAGGITDTDQLGAAVEVIREIEEAEDVATHRNTAVVGDFNMYPYDQGMTSVIGFHALVTKRLAEQPDRKYRHRPRRRFYNPMWGLMGDRTPGPAGSFRWNSSVPHNPHWGILDQLLLRKNLMDRFYDLSILERDGMHDLLDQHGFPNKEAFSDHLPVLFRLDV
jgi:hypothetical protein